MDRVIELLTRDLHEALLLGDTSEGMVRNAQEMVKRSEQTLQRLDGRGGGLRVVRASVYAEMKSTADTSRRVAKRTQQLVEGLSQV
jgi:hypothetical protein